MSLHKKIYIIITLIILAGVGLVGIVGERYYSDFNLDKDVELVGDALVTPEDICLGKNVTVSSLLKTPWHRWPMRVAFSPAMGSQIINQPVIKLKKIGFGYTVWEIKSIIQPYRTGDLKESKIEIELNQSEKGFKMKSISQEVPGFEVSSVDLDSSELALASKVEPKELEQNKNYWIIISSIVVGLALIIIILIIVFRRKKRTEVIIPVWERVLSSICLLRSKLENGEIKAKVSIFELNDIVREYLEERFNLPSAKTTPEFMVDLEKSKKLLSDNHKVFLKDFMSSSDLVKFANLPAEIQLVNDAISKAEQLVQETIPNENTSTTKELK